MLEAREGGGEAFERLASCTRLVRIKKEEDHVRVLREPPSDAEKVVAALGGRALGHRRIVRQRVGFGRVDHAGRIDEDETIRVEALSHLERKVIHKRRAECAQRAEAEARVADEGCTVAISVLGAGLNDGEAIIGRRQPCFLDVFSQQMVDEGRLAR